MKSMLSAAALAALLVSGSALAQTSTSSSSPSSTSSVHGQISQSSIKQDLEKAGFTNVQFVDAAYMVQAKTGDGADVVMAFNPGSVTSTGSSGMSASSTSSSGSQHPPTQSDVKQSLEKSGFRDVQVVPTGYLMSATTPSGEKVALTISPLGPANGSSPSSSSSGSSSSGATGTSR